MSAAQVLDRVNERDQRIGTIARADVFKLHANFRVVHVFIFNPAGDLLLQKIAANRHRHPGRWGSSLAAYVAAGEDYAEAATRRLQDELGIPNLNLVEIGKTQMHDVGCLKFITLYAGHYAGPFALDPSHIAEVEFVSLDELLQAAIQSPSRFTPTFLHLLDFYVRTRPS
jgi:isopentenyl-diphosphate delta-isomerase